MSNQVNIRFGSPDNSPTKPQVYSPLIPNAQGLQQPLSPSYRGNTTPKITFNQSNNVSPTKINTDPAQNNFPIIQNISNRKEFSDNKEHELPIHPVVVHKVDDELICSRTCWIIATVLGLILLAIALVFTLNVFGRISKNVNFASSSPSSSNLSDNSNTTPNPNQSSSTNASPPSTDSSTKNTPPPAGTSSVSPLPPSPNVAYVAPTPVQPSSVTSTSANPTFVART